MNERLSALKTQLHQIAALRPEQARGLPGAFYTDPQFFEYERTHFLRDEWHCLGRADELSSPGDYFTTRLLDEPLLVVKGEDGAIRVLSNVCRHRGMTLLQGKGTTRRIVCGYHAWSYNRDGTLAVAPRFDRARLGPECNLPEFRCELWQGFIYVNLDEAAAPLAPRLRALEALIAPYEPEKMRIVHVAEEVWRANWKCLIENFMEAYHLSIVHPETLRPYVPTSAARKGVDDPSFTSYEANYDPLAAPRGLGSAKLSEAERRRSTLFCLYPTHIVSVAATLLSSISVQPLTADSLSLRWTLSTYENELSQDLVDERIALWNDVNAEDRRMLERLQPALASRHARSGPLSGFDTEGTIYDFVRYLSRAAGFDG